MPEKIGIFFYLWPEAIVFLLILIGGLEAGHWIRSRTSSRRKKADGAFTVQASILGLLALVLSFTYSFVANRLEERKSAVIREANAIGTAYLRADFAPEPMRSQLRSLLELYARTRLIDYQTAQTARTRAKASEAVARSLEVQKQLWPIVQHIMELPGAGPKEALLAQAVNDVIDLHTFRLTAAFDRLPGIVFVMLLVIAALGMFITGYNGGKANRWSNMAFAVVLAMTMYVIVDMDRSRVGFVRVTQQPLIDVISSMQGQETNSDKRLSGIHHGYGAHQAFGAHAAER